MSCLYGFSQTRGKDPANVFGDLYDTIMEPGTMRGAFFMGDPCADPTFCQCGIQFGLGPESAMSQASMGNFWGPIGGCLMRAGIQKQVRQNRQGMGGMPGMEMGQQNPMMGGMNPFAAAMGASMNPMMQSHPMAGMNAMGGGMGGNPTSAAATGNPMINAIMGKAQSPVPTPANNMNSLSGMNSMSSLSSSLSTNQIMPKAVLPMSD